MFINYYYYYYRIPIKNVSVYLYNDEMRYSKKLHSFEPTSLVLHFFSTDTGAKDMQYPHWQRRAEIYASFLNMCPGKYYLWINCTREVLITLM